MNTNIIRHKSVLSFILSERILTLTVICSVVTFQFLGTFKAFIVDPLLDFLLPEEKFDFLNLTIRDGQEIPKPDPKKLVLDFGLCLKEFIKWIFVITLIFLLAKYTYVPDEPAGNARGSALM